MKQIFQIISILACLIAFAMPTFGQNQEGSLRDRLAKRQQQQEQQQAKSDAVNVPKLSVRAEMMNQEQTQDLSNATWIREVYRELDLTKGKNAALYYPVQPIGGKMNFYTMIFKLMANGDIVGYEWNDGQDLFVDKLKIDFADVLDKLSIPYQREGNSLVFDDFSIPSNEVLGYYIKEIWYFDQTTSKMGVKIAAICPIWYRQEYLDDVDAAVATAIREPQFWIPYESIRPYAARMPILASDLNNVMSKTVDDYFRTRLYEGDIYKTTNMENKFLQQIFTTPESLKHAQDSIENQLKRFDQNLWVINDSINDILNSGNNKKSKTQKRSKPKSSSSGAAYSARDRR